MNLDAAAASTKVRDLMTSDVVTVAPGTALRDALALMVERNVGSLIVTGATSGAPLQRGEIVGMVPVFFALRESIRGGDLPVETAMFTDLIFAGVDESVAVVLARITSNKTWRLVVLDREKVAGVVSATDIIRLFGDAMRKET